MAQIRYEFIFDDKGVVTGVNKINEGLDKSDTSAQKTAKTVESASGTMSAGLGGVAKIAAGLGLSFGALEAARIFRQSIDDALEFQDKMANVNSILGESQISSQQLGRELLELSGSLGTSAQLADAMYEAIGAGVKPAESIQFVTEATKLAKATLADTGETTKLLATVMNAYGLKISEVTHISDVFTETVSAGIVRGEELAHELGTVIPTAALLGVSIEEVSAAVATMTRTGINASEATTALNQALLSFLKPSKEAAAIAEQLGIDLSANAIHTKGFSGALAELKDKVGSNDEALIAMFGSVRGGRAALSLTGEQAGFFTAEIEKMREAVGTTDKAFEKQQLTIHNQLIRAWNDLQRTMDGFLNEAGGPVATVLKTLNDEAEKGWNPIKELKGGYIELFVAIGNVKEALFGTSKAVKEASIGMGDLKEAERALTPQQEKTIALTKEQAEAAEKFSKEVESLTGQLRPNSHEVDVLNTALKKLDDQGVSSTEIVKKFGDKTLEARSAMIEMGKAVPQMINQVALETVMKKALDAQAKFNKDALQDFEKSEDGRLDYLTKNAEKIMQQRQKELEALPALLDKAFASQKQMSADAEQSVRDGLDETLKYREYLMGIEEKERAAGLKKNIDDLDAFSKQQVELQKKANAEVRESAGHVWDDMFTNGQNVFGSLLDLGKGFANTLGRTLFQDIAEALFGPLQKAFTDFFNTTVKGIIDGALGGIGKSIGGMISGALGIGGAALPAGALTSQMDAAVALGGAGATVPLTTGGGIGGAGFAAIAGPAALAAGAALLVTKLLPSSPFGNLQDALYVMLTEKRRMDEVHKAGIDLDALALQYPGMTAGQVLAIGESLAKPQPAVQTATADTSANDPYDQSFWDYFFQNAPQYAYGTDYVPRTGPAILHQGEAVLTREENQNREGNVEVHFHMGTVYGDATAFLKQLESGMTRLLQTKGEFKTTLRRQLASSY